MLQYEADRQVFEWCEFYKAIFFSLRAFTFQV